MSHTDINLLDLPNDSLNEILIKINKTYKQNATPEDRCFDDPNPNDEIADKFFIRSEFSRDRDKILFSKAFRRLEHKAQVYSHEKGDHFRTRLTHTLEVMQIARSLAKNLRLNEDLTEAIALGHDIGHTPFGHIGEYVLNDVMSGRDNLGDKINFKINFNGFKHNFYSLKILDLIEKKYEGEKGLNMTWQVLDGILNHTKIKREGEYWKLDRFMNDSENKTLLKKLMNIEEDERTFSATLEGQIVDVADEIAQRQHDLDDGLRDKDLRLDYDEIVDHLCSFIDETKSEILDKETTGFQIKLLDILKNKIILIKSSTDNKYKWITLIRDVIDYFIRDVTLNSIENIYQNDFEGLEVINGKKIVIKRLISLSEAGKKIDEKIENYIKFKILNSYNVNRFDGKAIFVVRRLFKAYYENPRQMPKDSLEMLSSLLKKNSENIYKIQFRNEEQDEEITYLHDINFNSSDPKFIERLVNLMKLDKLDVEIKNIENSHGLTHLFKSNPSKEDFHELYEHLDKVNKLNLNEIKNSDLIYTNKDELLFVKCLLENHYAYLSVICDYIACMTDNFANNEFKQLYMV